MRTKSFCFRARPAGIAALPVAILVILLGVLQTACGSVEKVEGQVPDKAASTGAGLLTVPNNQLQHLGIVPVQRKAFSISVLTTGTVDWNGDRTTQAITQVSGPISRILVDLGSKVNAGDPLLYVSSSDVANAVSAYRKARNHELLTKRVVDRMRELLAHGAVATKDVQSSEADYNDAATDVQTSLQALKIFGITKKEIDDADQQGAPIGAELALRAPIAGIIVQKLVSPGQLIQAGSTVCFVLSDVSTVWVQGHIFDRDLPTIRVGDPVDATNPAAGRAFHGEVSYVGAIVDPATRTTPVRIVTRNTNGLLKKDMFVDAVIHTSKLNNLLTVPVSAVLRDEKNEPIVYVEAEPGRFAQRSVTLGPQQGDAVAITAGVREGEKVVSEGSLFLQFANSIQ
jgi:cobalt-zinc-cadmium efflux system membrane fusion protein